MKGKKIKDILSAVIICAVLLTFLSGCSDKKVDVTVSSTVSGKVTKSGVIEYNGQYFIWDRNGVNYKSDIDTKSIVVAHTSKKNGRVLSNFAVTDDYVFFIGEFKGDSNILYRNTTTGLKRERIYVRDVINIVGAYNNKVYITDEQNVLKCIDGKTCEEVSISLVKGTQFVQKNNCIFYKNVSGDLKVYNCDTDTIFTEILGENVDKITACDNGIAYVINQSAKEGEYKYTQMFMNTIESTVGTRATINSNQPVALTTQGFSFVNTDNSLVVYKNSNGEMTEEKTAKKGKLVYNGAVGGSAYYFNDNICWKYGIDAEEKQPKAVDFAKAKIDYNKVLSVINESYVVYIDAEGYYGMLKI